MDNKLLLDQIYYDMRQSSSAFTSPRNIYLEARRHNPAITLKQVSDYLANQETYTRHKLKRIEFTRNRVVALGIDTNWQADLCDVKSLWRFNRPYRHLLTVIDVFSKFGFAEPIKNKTPEMVIKAFQKIMNESGRKPFRLFTDRGSEFIASTFKDFADDEGIELLTSQNDTVKASVAERYNRTLKSRLWKYFSFAKTKHYLKALPYIVKGINHSYHRSIKMRPVDVTEETRDEVYQNLYGEMNREQTRFHYELGNLVRIPMKKSGFNKGYEPNFSKELYTICQQLPRNPPMYRVKDSDDRILKRTFYDKELVSVQQQLEPPVAPEQPEPEEEPSLPPRKRKAPKRYGWSPI
jgi:transposase InsO family protein